MESTKVKNYRGGYLRRRMIALAVAETGGGDIPIGVNLINLGTIYRDGYINPNGTIQDGYKGWFYSDYIPIKPAHIYEVYVDPNYWGNWPLVFYYDNEKNFIIASPSFQYGIPHQIEPYPNAAYVRITGPGPAENAYFKRIS